MHALVNTPANLAKHKTFVCVPFEKKNNYPSRLKTASTKKKKKGNDKQPSATTMIAVFDCRRRIASYAEPYYSITAAAQSMGIQARFTLLSNAHDVRVCSFVKIVSFSEKSSFYSSLSSVEGVLLLSLLFVRGNALICQIQFKHVSRNVKQHALYFIHTYTRTWIRT